MKVLLTAIVCVAIVLGGSARAQDVPVITFAHMEKMLDNTSDTLFIFNFWATWCGPCVRELPAFERITKDYRNRKVKVVLVSLDFTDVLRTKVIPFVQQRKLVSDVVLLDPGKGGAWIDKVSPDWSGAIPATLFVRGASAVRRFYEQAFEFDELNSIVQQYLGDQQ